MIKKVFYLIILLSVFVNPLAFPAFAQNSIKGIITDAVFDEPLPGANVFLDGTAFGAATDGDGFFTIPDIPAGQYTLYVNYIGYLEKNFAIEVKEGEKKILNVQLEAGIIEGEVITVTAQAEGQAAAINQQLQANTIKNVVSAERIQELPDANAAESVGRLPGVSIKRSGGEANMVVIRGLAPTYNTITISGEQIPATDLNDRSVDMSMISPQTLAGIEVTKALTPDKDADAIGGTIDFKLANARAGGFYYDVRYEGAYHEQYEDFGMYRGSLILSDRFIDEKFGVMITANLEKTPRGSNEYSADYYRPHEQREGEGQLQFSIGDLVLVDREEIRRRYGGSLLLDYQLPFGKILFTNFLSRLDRDEVIMSNKYNEDSNWHERRVKDRQTQIDIVMNSIGGEFDFNFAQVDLRLSRAGSLQRRPYENYIRFKETGAFDRALIPNVGATDQDLIAAAYNDLAKTNLYSGDFYTERSWESNLAAQLNIQLPYNFGSQVAGYLKIGGKFREKYRERDRGHASRRLDEARSQYEKYHTRNGDPDFEFITVPGVGWASFLNYINRDYDQGNYLDGTYDFGPAPDAEELTHLLDVYLLDSLYRFSPYADMDDYNLEEDVGAAYIMTEINFGRLFTLMPGVRYEYTRADMTGRRGVVSDNSYEPELDETVIFDTTAVNKYDNWFPMLHLRVKPVSWFDVRLAYTETISRPRLDWMLPKWRYIGSATLLEMGRPDLKPQLATNYDLFLSFYGGWVGLFTLGGFYKEIDDLIYLRQGRVILDAEGDGIGSSNLNGSFLDRPENNPFQTIVRGLEIEWQTNFRWLPSPFNGLVLYANYAHIWSETKYPRSFIRNEQIPYPPFLLSTPVDTFRIGTMIDQASDIANIALGYDIGGFSARISMLYQGRTLSRVGERPEYDSFIEDYLRWDLQVKQDITKHFSVYFYLNNISDRPDESFLRDSGHPTSIQYYGWTAALGLRLHN